MHVIDLPTGRRVATVELRNWFYTADATNCLPDLQLDATGTAFVSDSVQSKLWRIDANDFALREHSLTPTTQQWVDAGFSALVLQDDGSIVAAAGAPGTLWHIDRQLSNAEPIALDTPLHGACAMERFDTSENEIFVLAAGREVFTVYRFALARVRPCARCHRGTRVQLESRRPDHDRSCPLPRDCGRRCGCNPSARIRRRDSFRAVAARQRQPGGAASRRSHLQ